MIDELLLTLKSLRPINLVLFISVPCINYVTKKIYNFFFFLHIKITFSSDDIQIRHWPRVS